MAIAFYCLIILIFALCAISPMLTAEERPVQSDFYEEEVYDDDGHMVYARETASQIEHRWTYKDGLLVKYSTSDGWFEEWSFNPETRVVISKRNAKGEYNDFFYNSDGKLIATYEYVWNGTEVANTKLIKYE